MSICNATGHYWRAKYPGKRCRTEVCLGCRQERPMAGYVKKGESPTLQEIKAAGQRQTKGEASP